MTGIVRCSTCQTEFKSSSGEGICLKCRIVQPGTRIGQYAIDRLLGKGSNGFVCLAHGVTDGYRVAIKLMLTGTARGPAFERFGREPKMMERLRHRLRYC
jgi:serine/threonine protein kinase